MMSHETIYNVTAIILASGFSKRYEGNKLITKIAGKKMYAHVIDLVCSINFKEKIIVTNDFEIEEYSRINNLKCIKNSEAFVGKSKSIKLGIANSSTDTSGYIFFMCDQPFIRRDSVLKILDKFISNDEYIIYPKYDGHKGAPIVFPKKFKKFFNKLKGDDGGSKFINLENSISIDIDNKIEGKDIDTIEDFLILEKLYLENKDN